MAADLVQEYMEKTTHSLTVQRTVDDLLNEHKEKIGMGESMYENSVIFLTSFAGYKPKSGEPL